jgi:hypothetical protein
VPDATSAAADLITAWKELDPVRRNEYDAKAVSKAADRSVLLWGQFRK